MASQTLAGVRDASPARADFQHAERPQREHWDITENRPFCRDVGAVRQRPMAVIRAPNTVERECHGKPPGSLFSFRSNLSFGNLTQSFPKPPLVHVAFEAFGDRFEIIRCFGFNPFGIICLLLLIHGRGLTVVRYLIYCDESDDKGEFYSNFYGGAILKLSDQKGIETRLLAAKGAENVDKEFKWSKITPYMEEHYLSFVRETFAVVRAGQLKIRVMFTQNIHQTRHLDYDEENKFFILYYHFLNHAFGLRHCNVDYPEQSFVHVAVDAVPGTKAQFASFKNFLSSLSDYPAFSGARVCIPKASIFEVDSKEHVIIQAVDVILGSMQFRLNNKHKWKEAGARVRAQRTRTKERIYNEVRSLIQEIYPNFNIGISTGQRDPSDRWNHPYAHWRFVPRGSIMDKSRGKKHAKRR